MAVDVQSGPFSIWLCDPEICACTNEFCDYLWRECLVTQLQVELVILVIAPTGRLDTVASPPPA